MDSISRGFLIHGGNLPLRSPPTSRQPNLCCPTSLRLPFPGATGPRSSRGAAKGVRASSGSGSISRSLKSAGGALVLTAATAAALFAASHAIAAHPRGATSPDAPPRVATEERTGEEGGGGGETKASPPSVLSQFLEYNTEAVEALRAVLYEKLENGEDEEALKILERLTDAQPWEAEWKLLTARLLNEMGRVSEARKLYEDILSADPLSFEALFENAVLMDRCGEGDAVIKRLEDALEVAKGVGKEKEARDVRLIMAQIQFLQKKVDEALASYEELAKEDPKDYRPYFCQGVIYSLLDRNKEAREKFAKYKELSPKKFEVEGFLQTPLSRVKLFGVGESGK